MKVQMKNKSSKNTDKIIKEAFAELISEKKELRKIRVVDLVKKAGIARSSFYTHYDSIYDVVEDMQEETLDALMKDTENISDLEDANKYLDEITDYLKNNEAIYSLILSSDEAIYMVNNFNKMISKKLYDTLRPYNIKNLELNVNFFTDGCTNLLIKHYRKEINADLDEINIYLKEQFKKIFLG